MRKSRSFFVLKSAGALALALTVSACGSGGVGGLTSMMGGGQSAEPRRVTANTFGGVPVEQLRADQLCPSIVVRDGTETLRTYAGEERTPGNVRYQSQILQSVVECVPTPGQLGLSIGIAGRSIIGPQGTPAELALPLRVVVRNTVTDEVVSSNILPARAIIEPAQTSAVFTVVNRSLTIPMPDRQSDYQVIVGFDEQGTS